MMGPGRYTILHTSLSDSLVGRIISLGCCACSHAEALSGGPKQPSTKKLRCEETACVLTFVSVDPTTAFRKVYLHMDISMLAGVIQVGDNEDACITQALDGDRHQLMGDKNPSKSWI
jgi:hypothetical protein